MPSFSEISAAQLARLVGTPDAPLILDLRLEADYAADPRLAPAALRRDHQRIAAWAGDCALRGRPVVTICQGGGKIAHGAAAWLRAEGLKAEALEGGFSAWRAMGGLLFDPAKAPPGGLWVTRTRPKIDRVACPWLIRRFVDPGARFLFVPPAEVEKTAAAYGAAPFDVEGVFWSHRGEFCTFDVMLSEFGLSSPALELLARAVRGADTARLDLAPQAAGLLAVSAGYSRLFREDLAQIEAAMTLYDALYLWARDASDESHNWPAPGAKP